MAEAPLLEACHLRYGYAGHPPALRGANLRLATGSRMALLGPNGAGKSTLLLLLQGVIEPQEGTILLAGQPVSYRRQELWAWRQQIGLVLQNPDEQIFAPTVWQDLSFGPANLGWDEERICRQVEKALAAMELEAIKDRPTHQLSHGQKRRVSIAGVLAMEPRLLLLDEPTASLDPDTGDMVRSWLERYRAASGCTILLASHNMAEVERLCSDVLMLKQGRIVDRGSPADLLARYGRDDLEEVFLDIARNRRDGT